MNDNKQRLQAATNLDELYPVLDALRMTPGWHKKRPSLWPEPRTRFQPLHWSYDVGRVALDQAGRWIGMELAERRNLLLFNPVGDNDYDSVRTLVVAFQMLKPGEHARAHWHTPNAMRFVLDAEDGCYSIVNGVKVPMRTGDVLLTPAYAWHSHYNEGQGNAYWIDILDVPLVHLLEPMFWEEHPERYQPVTAEPEEHPFYRPHARNRELLAAAAPQDGVRRVLLDTANEIKTFDIGFTAIEAGSRRVQPRTTASRIIAVGQGRGCTRIGGLTTQWARGDVLAVPSWTPYEIEAHEDAVLLEATDTPVMKALGYYREQ
jgi:gentisate 1,2-dioxygenase